MECRSPSAGCHGGFCCTLVAHASPPKVVLRPVFAPELHTPLIEQRLERSANQHTIIFSTRLTHQMFELPSSSPPANLGECQDETLALKAADRRGTHCYPTQIRPRREGHYRR
jgi:hypothetical protein